MIKLFNTLSRSKEEFRPINNKKVGLYTCGPTVYNYAHIGNLRSYVFEDILKRTIIYNGYKVKHVMNITDVGHLTGDRDMGEDKLEKEAKIENKSAWDIAKFYTKAFKENLKRLNIEEPDIWCKATDHIKEQVNLIKILEQKGYTYRISDGIYYDTSKFANYTNLSKQNLSELQEGARVEKNDEKKNPADFALWKFSPKDKKRQMEWDSPWGTGFPGWHIECSAMSMKYLGEQFDIHCGGVDHINVHHTNEIAQSEAATGKSPWVKFWLHGEFLNIKGAEKMAKSSDNFTTLNSLIEKGYNPIAYRYLLLTAHYRTPLEFSFESLDSAQNALNNLFDRLRNAKPVKIDLEKYQNKFKSLINDDLNTPQAVAYLWDIIKDPQLTEGAKRAVAENFDQVFGLGIKRIKKERIVIPEELNKLVKKRDKARADKNFALADEIRRKILERGFEIDDTPKGSKLKKKVQ